MGKKLVLVGVWSTIICSPKARAPLSDVAHEFWQRFLHKQGLIASFY